jgi:acetyl-CoA synthetase
VAERLIEIRPGMDYESLRRDFRWSIPERVNLGVACSDAHDPDAAALVVDRGDATAETITFGALSDRSSRLAGGLRHRGVGRGDRVAVVVPQSLETGFAHLAIWKLGAVSVPMASLFGPDALAYRLGDSGSRLVITDRANEHKLIEAARAVNQHIDIVVVERDLEDLARRDPIEPASTAAEDPAFLIYTSGTTGPPKGALHAHRSVYGHLPAFELFYELAPQPGDLIWTPADWAWIGALMDVLVPAWFHGMPVLTARQDFDAVRAIELMARQGVTLAFLPPTALKMMRAADVGGEGLSLRAVFTGGEPLGEEMLAWSLARLGAVINEGYGQTECNLVVGNCSSIWPVRPGSMGRAVPGHEVAVLDVEGDRVVGEEGEVCVRSPDPVMMLGYWNNPDATAEKYRDGWLRTGDLAVQDTDGYLWFRSRTDDIISSRGYRIGPGEIEDCLMAHPAVAMCAVVGVPDEIRGQVPAAFVVRRDTLTASNAPTGDELVGELKDHVRTRLAAHEVPAHVRFVDDLPRTTTGKILRRDLRDGWEA